MFLLNIIFGIFCIYIFSCSIFVSKNETVIIERFGRYSRTLSSGLNFIIPFIEKPRLVMRSERGINANGRLYTRNFYSKFIDLRETVYDFSTKNINTKDNIAVKIIYLLYFTIINPIKAAYVTDNLPEAIEKAAQINIKKIINQFTYEEILDSRDIINRNLKEILDKDTDKWGVKVNLVEIQDIMTLDIFQHAIGLTAKVIQPINFKEGMVDIFDKRMEARLKDKNEEIPKGCSVKIIGNDNFILYVERI